MGSFAAFGRSNGCTLAVALGSLAWGCDPAPRSNSHAVSNVPAPSVDGGGGGGGKMDTPLPTDPFEPNPPLMIGPPVNDQCENPRLSASSLEGSLGGPVRFIGLFGDGIIGELSDGEDLLVHLPNVEVERLPPDARALRILSTSGLYVLGCSQAECALLEPDTARSGFLRRVRGGTVPVSGDFRYLATDGFRLCVSDERRATLCFDRVQWDAADGGSISTRVDAGAPDTGTRDAGARDAAVRPVLDPGPPPCAAPIYCDAADLAEDPLCYYSFEETSNYLEGVTVAGRMVTAHYTGTGTAQCSTSRPYGTPVARASSGCGLSRHVVMLTADGLYETCGCILD